ncbi:PilW family protein [Pelosinus sp. UFO1]|uniref:PilW family protein n=1 Tax=Pelosinus sp. UFO1 TaxID=484770 RepID=UPI0004D0F573|nr:hypothetical protein [Pelosinus sp. UFO1]AIF51788.1 hypothetical protein UFO1_2241 [Pelosinus sp. UFO1]
MKKAYLTAQDGLTLVELLISITLMLTLLSGIADLFSESLRLWIFNRNQENIQQTARLAMDSIAREIRYAQQITFKNKSSLLITKPSGENNTFQLGGGTHSKTIYIIIDKTKTKPAGGISSNPITENFVTNLDFLAYPESENPKAVMITLETTDENTGEKKLLHTACYPLNKGGMLNEQ